MNKNSESENIAMALHRAADRLTDDNWIQWYTAMTKDGHCVSPYDKDASKWCLLGAVALEIFIIGNDETARLPVDAFGIATEEVRKTIHDHEHSAGPWNDEPGRTAGEVREVLRTTAERISAEV